PIAALPNELLCLIFDLCRPDPRERPREYIWWISRITRVCHRWRIAAIGEPYLWRFLLSPCGPRRIRTALSRCKEMPLIVVLDSDDFTVSGWEAMTSDILVSPANRLQEVALTVSDHAISSIPQLLFSPAPILRWLTVKLPSDNPVHFSSFKLLGGCAPELRELTLEHCILPWSSPVLSGLTHLEVIQKSESGITINVDKVLQSLRNMPNLVNLHLGEALTGRDDLASSSGPPAHLPHL
ncbi:hypothetical protein BKA70DRAFT_1097640, partial [Coprinopsis sp. MPI-PUGE-AT-0042]